MTRFMALFARSQLAFIGLIILSLILILAILTPWLPLNDPNVIDTSNRFKRPFSEDSILGTDHLGRDLLSRLLWGTRLSIAGVVFVAACYVMFNIVVDIIQSLLDPRIKT